MTNEILLIQITLFTQTTDISWAVEKAFRNHVDDEELAEMVLEARTLYRTMNSNIIAWNYFIIGLNKRQLRTLLQYIESRTKHIYSMSKFVDDEGKINGT